MLSRRHYRFADDMREICSHCVIPIHSHQAQRRTGNETSAYAKKAAQNSNHKTNYDQIDRVDVSVGDREKHDLSPAAEQEPKKERRHRVQSDSLTGDEQQRDDGVQVTMLRLELVQPLAQKMKNQEKINGDED